MRDSLFQRGPSPLLRLLVLAALSLALLFLDRNTHQLDTTRSVLATLLHPLQVAADLPVRARAWLHEHIAAHHTRITRNQALREENRLLRARLARFAALQRENEELRALLHSARRLETRLASARLLAISMTPYRQQAVIDKGTQDGVEVGMPVIDEHGLVGQIIRAHPYHAEVMLISDPNHATPVQDLRSGVRSIAQGTGRTDVLNLLYLPANTDIREGDLLVTSGLGGRFPPDYPVARVAEVSRAPGSAFAHIRATPLAHLNTGRKVLLVTARPLIPAAPPDDEARPAAEAETNPP